MNRIHIVGRKNSGKTTLIVELVEHLTRKGLRIGTIKHTHHNHELDTPGKDSYLHRQAGSAAVGILSPLMNAVFWPDNNKSDGEKTARYEQFDVLMNDCDIVFVEGDSSAKALKIEVYRAANGSKPMAANDATIQAVITDDSLDLGIPTWQRSDLDTIAQNVKRQIDLS